MQYIDYQVKMKATGVKSCTWITKCTWKRIQHIYICIYIYLCCQRAVYIIADNVGYVYVDVVVIDKTNSSLSPAYTEMERLPCHFHYLGYSPLPHRLHAILIILNSEHLLRLLSYT